MTYFALVIEVMTETGGVVFEGLYRVDAQHGADAVERICQAKRVSPSAVFLISEEEARQWAALEIPVRRIP